MFGVSVDNLQLQNQHFCKCYNLVAWKGAFIVSISTHNIENKSYICRRCQKYFSPSDNVIVHNLIHSLTVLDTFNILIKKAVRKNSTGTGSSNKNVTCNNHAIDYRELSSISWFSEENLDSHKDPPINRDKECISNVSNGDSSSLTKSSLISHDENRFAPGNANLPVISSVTPMTDASLSLSLLTNFVETIDSKKFECPKTSVSSKQLAPTESKSVRPAKKILLCEICSRKFTKEEVLKIHMELHTPYCCSICNYLFHYDTGPRKLRSHAQTHYVQKSKNSFSCCVCHSHFISEKDVIQHLMSHSTANTCNLCYSIHKLCDGFIFFFCVHAGGDHHTCLKCCEYFENSSDLKAHYFTCDARTSL